MVERRDVQPVGMTIDYHVPIPMRDGVVTYANVLRPLAERCPVLLCRTPYGKDRRRNESHTLDPIRAVQRGYALVIQDVRGRFTSGGEFHPFFHEIADGFDSVQWCAEQPWSTGHVGMFGRSYLGATQWLAAMGNPPALKAIAPGVTSSNYYDGWTYQGGALQLGFALSWAASSLALADFSRLASRFADAGAERTQLTAIVNDLYAAYQHLPLKEWPGLRSTAPYYYEWLEHPSYDEYWRKTAAKEHYSRIDIPSFNYGGWFDIFQQGTIDNYVGMSGMSNRLVMGPWSHRTYDNYLGDVNFGLHASADAVDLEGLKLQFFDRWLRGVEDNFVGEQPVRLFTMGANEWRSAREWPLPQTKWTPLYLHSGGGANTLSGDGRLSLVQPGQQPPDVFVYDPRNPVPTRGGPVHISVAGTVPPGPFDQRIVEQRHDVLVYTSAPLEYDLEVTGPVQAVVWAISSADDTDFTAKLVDVYPDGRAISVTDGIIRAGYRDGLETPTPITPDEPYRYTIELGSTSIVFKRGHRIRVEISSSNFPRFDRNLNIFGPLGEIGVGRAAMQTVLHQQDYPSHLLLPVIPEDG